MREPLKDLKILQDHLKEIYSKLHPSATSQDMLLLERDKKLKLSRN